METEQKKASSLNRQILRKYNGLTKLERNVADMVMRLGEELIDFSISELASQSRVSEPTVIRFCRSLGYRGIKELKRAAVKTDFPTAAPVGMMKIDQIASGEDMTAFVFGNIDGVLGETRKTLDTESMSRAIELLSKARYVKVAGFGGSSIIARHAQHYLRMLGLHVDIASSYLPNDSLLEDYAQDDVVIAISLSGNTSMVVDIALDAKRKGASIVGLTAWGDNQIHALADVSLQGVYIGEGIIPGFHVIERTSLIALVDILLTGVYLRRMR